MHLPKEACIQSSNTKYAKISKQDGVLNYLEYSKPRGLNPHTLCVEQIAMVFECSLSQTAQPQQPHTYTGHKLQPLKHHCTTTDKPTAYPSHSPTSLDGPSTMCRVARRQATNTGHKQLPKCTALPWTSHPVRSLPVLKSNLFEGHSKC